MKRKNQDQKDVKVIRPQSSTDIENVVKFLQEKENSAIIDMSGCKYVDKEAVERIMKFISINQKTYITLNVKKIFPKVLVCWSEHPELYI